MPAPRPHRARADKPPGTLVPPAGAYSPPHLQVMQYGPDTLTERRVESLAELGDLRQARGITWVNVDGLGNARVLEEMRDRLGIHPLALEDVLSTGQRPKVEDYPNHFLIVLRMLTWNDHRLDNEQLSLFLCGSVVITFQERPGDCFDGIRQRLRRTGGQIRQQGADYLAYALIDAVVDSYFPLLEELGATVQQIEDELERQPDEAFLRRLYTLKRHLLTVRHAVWPMRDALGRMLRDEDDRFSQVVHLHLRDCQDHTVRLIDLIELNREAMGGLLEVYLSVLSNRMNETMKVLTVISTVFIPLTFVAGVYGMNFRYMPELGWRWGYAAVWLVMLLMAAGMLALFYIRGWLGARPGRLARPRRKSPPAAPPASPSIARDERAAKRPG